MLEAFRWVEITGTLIRNQIMLPPFKSTVADLCRKLHGYTELYGTFLYEILAISAKQICKQYFRSKDKKGIANTE